MSDLLAQAVPVLAHAASRTLGWRPDEFWTATPAELVMALVEPGTTATAPLTRDDILELIERDSHG